MELDELVVGETYDLRIAAKNPNGDGIGRINDVVVFVRNTKPRLGKTYKVKITNTHKTFAYAEPLDNSKPFIGNGSLIL
ncbi:MAG: TRAM domain-containing protein [Candidatus Micrarchaeota archaeon]|nr:TRAM domain-containing protein [Candidatus Micrarchaeota archaeon]MDE1833749.1 TRAM domain-containing protein [Candidatus Micrarchaeota archaeon]MDE1859425.1 TRAM domain-containing protein [Candidatus Micrarchaeota archaeon]